MIIEPVHYLEVTQAVSRNLAVLREDIPDVMRGFGEMARAAARAARSTKRPKK